MKKFGSIKLILRTYALVIGVFFVFRCILFFTELDRIDFQEVSMFTIINSFIMGIRFDTVISSYILILPALVLFVMEILNKKSSLIKTIIFYWIALLFTIAFIISTIDIPYFNQFFSRLSVGALAWVDSFGFVFKMISQEPKQLLFAIPLLTLLYLFYSKLRKIFRKDLSKNDAHIVIKISTFIFCLGLIFLGIRGRLEEKSPIRIGTAYISNHSFLNQMGLNPVFTLMRSYIDSQNNENDTIQMMDDQVAIAKVQNALGLTNLNQYESPIARKIIPDSTQTNQPNIVLVMMESMSASKMKRHGNTRNLTPFLDSLSHKSIYFENIYTAGKHTFNGIFGTMFSFPAIYRQHSLKSMNNYHGLSTVLRKKGYSTTYFTTHDGQFDNVEGFLKDNAFENIYTESKYPSSEIKTILGVPDDFMFRFSIPIINDLHKENKPFFVSFMTTSDHMPFYIPEYFEADNEKNRHKIVEYADWSLRQLVQMSSKEEWFDNTIFIFVADHGAPISAPYDISLDYHHAPLLFYSPKLIKTPQTYTQIGGQIDVFPTLMGLLKQPYINNTLGIDLLKEQRPYIFINDDDKIGVLSDSLFLILKEKEAPKLYKYKNNNTTDYSKDYPEIIKSMETYTKANLQTFQYMLLNKETLKSPE
ncbi:LTA synthase family protein [Psychroserpens ponticola]|uniref:Sulfatase-like hydrolase/transferase n=1 Tax=Psychroserpens ponticola TaxID=2932268 RepID=A0ABY7RZA6_9FLAO|nr:alkaline phosphatase family protein [Psychroserpens ponticola]WCO02392.1 sulfatase-like hydrolase/transferase [Psychroserpens ponticola]